MKALLLALLFVVEAGAANPIRGAGVTLCADYLAAWNLPNPTAEQIARNLQRFHWVLGFVSAYNHYNYREALHRDPRRNGVFGDTDGLLVDWLPAYCSANPRHDLYWAAQAFIRAQESQR